IRVNTSIIQNAENIGFITPSSFVAIILKNIFENNSIAFSDIGGAFQKNSAEVSRYLGMPLNNGIIVRLVEIGGFLEKAKIQAGDVITSMNGMEIDRNGIFIGNDPYHRRNIFDEIKLIPIGTKVALTLWRDTKELKIQALTSSAA